MKYIYFFYTFLISTISFAQSSVLITEVADPRDNTGNRFVEICNRGNSDVDISRWKIHRYSNGNTNSRSGTVPNNTVLPPNKCFIFSNGSTELTFTCPSINTVIDGNGNDVYELRNQMDEVIDIYGEVGVNGTNEDWDYKDSFAVRNPGVSQGRTRWENAEWTIDIGDTEDGTPCLDFLPQPVELVSLSATYQRLGVVIKWSTATEQNNDYFTIEHSLDGLNWSTIRQVEGHGTTQQRHNYDFLHKTVVNGVNYYRLKQVDIDNHYKYSDIVSVNAKGRGIQISSVNNRGLSILSNKPGKAHYIIYNSMGNIVSQGEFIALKGNQHIYYENGQLANGFYIIELIVNENKEIGRFVVN